MAYRVNGTIRIDNSGNFNAGILTAVDANVTGVVTATEFVGKISSEAITEQTEGSESDVTGADEVLIYDQTTGDLLRVTVDEFVAGSGIGTLVTEFETLSVTGVSTLSGAVSLGSSLTVPDGESIFLGDSGDLQITHSGANSFLIDNGAGNLIYRSGTQIFQNLAGSKTSAQFATANSVDLYFDGNLKFQTVSTGATVTGTLFATDIETSENLFVTGLSTFRLPVVMNRSDSFGVLDAALDVRQSVDVAGRLDLSGINGRLGLATVNNGGLQDIRYVGVDSSLVSSLSPSNEVIPTEKAVKEYVDGKLSAPQIQASALFESDATELSTFGCSVSRSSAGNYTITFDTAQPDTNYLVFLTISGDASGNGDVISRVVSRSTTSCDIRTAVTVQGARDMSGPTSFILMR